MVKPPFGPSLQHHIPVTPCLKRESYNQIRQKYQAGWGKVDQFQEENYKSSRSFFPKQTLLEKLITKPSYSTSCSKFDNAFSFKFSWAELSPSAIFFLENVTMITKLQFVSYYVLLQPFVTFNWQATKKFQPQVEFGDIVVLQLFQIFCVSSIGKKNIMEHCKIMQRKIGYYQKFNKYKWCIPNCCS